MENKGYYVINILKDKVNKLFHYIDADLYHKVSNKIQGIINIHVHVNT